MRSIILLLVFALPFSVLAQDDLLNELNQNKAETDYTFATFKGTRIINGHSVETKPAGTLEFIFSHRFGPISDGWFDMYGLDDAWVRLGLDYGITDNLSVSIGRNSENKTLDGYLKYKLLRQQSGTRNVPVTITLLEGFAYSFFPRRNSDVRDFDFQTIDRLAYTSQLLIARKFTSEFSLQIMPTFIHKNAVRLSDQKNDQFAFGAGGRYKFTKSVALTAEYYHNFSLIENSKYNHVLGIGFDIETGGHVFQLVFTNSQGLTERAFLTETEDNFFDGEIHFGFNVTRTFQFKKD
jgi:hypothetical protein